MKEYIGTKHVKAEPMTRGDYNEYRGWQTPEDEDPLDAGYFIEYLDGGQPNHESHEGYISWTPVGVFERAYVEVGTEPAVPATTYWERVLEEERELRARLDRLRVFLDTTQFKLLSLGEKQDIRAQAKAMNQYLVCLTSRISRF